MKLAILTDAAISILQAFVFSSFVRSAFLFAAWPSVSRLLNLPAAGYLDCLMLCVALEALAPRLFRAAGAPRAAVRADHPDALTAAAMRGSR